MSELTYTPGPWKTKKTNCGQGAVEAGQYILRHHWDGLGDTEEMDANARLIAAAPELLEALLDAKYALYGRGPANPKMASAIAKATGVK